MNKFFGLFIPLLLIGVIGYATWVIIALLSSKSSAYDPKSATKLTFSVNYLIRDVSRTGSGVAIIVIYFLLLLPMAISWFRTIIIIFTNPGYTARGPPNDSIPGVKVKFLPDEPTPAEQMFSKKKKQQAEVVKNEGNQMKPGIDVKGQYITQLDFEAIFAGEAPLPEGTERFWSNDVFQCDPNGLPIWCGACNNWKSDRVHHCSDVGRCVLKLDHFCPCLLYTSPSPRD